MELAVDATGWIRAGGRTFRCTLGRAGVRRDKAEGDGATPAGRFPLRRVLWRPDRLPRPETALPSAPLGRNEGWCDDPCDSAYNKPVLLPFAGGHEVLWRDDSLYDVIVVLGHNDSPPVPGKGSAIFMHVAAPGYAPTEGCIALALEDLLEVLALCAPGDTVTVTEDGVAGARRK